MIKACTVFIQALYHFLQAPIKNYLELYMYTKFVRMKDVTLDESGDLLIANGDFDISESDNRQQADIIRAFKGEYKEFPEVGVGISEMLNEDSYDEMLIEIKKQLEYDGMQISNVRFQGDGKLIVDGKYVNNG